ncbi:MAG: toprim domain-containing protein [Methylotenera sp.]|nr:toprim domain-containing protein [Methylotenera sp.]
MMNTATTGSKPGSATHNQPFNYTHGDSIQQFKSFMLDNLGYAPEFIIGDGNLHRMKDNNGKLNGAYTLHLNGRAAGYFQDFKQDIKESWKADGKSQPLSLIQRRQFVIERQRQEAERNAEEVAKHKAAADKARYIWSNSTSATDHPYLIKKRVKSHGLRVGRNNTLIVPIYDETKALVNLQFISETGGKMFLSGGKKKGCFSVIGKPGEIIQICEGWATGASLHQEIGHFTIVALDAGNLEPVAMVISKLYPDSQIVICGDNDESGVGQKAARAAALAVGGKYILPATMGHDFNDMLNMEGAL